MTAQYSDSRLTNLIAEGTGEILKGIRGVGLLRGRELGETGDDLAQAWICLLYTSPSPRDS